MPLRPRAWAIAGGTAFAGAAWAAGRLVPGYSHRDEPISALAAAGMRSGPVMVAGFGGLALATAGLASSVRGLPTAPPPVPALLGLASLTTLSAGLARCSERCCPSRFTGAPEATVSDEIHGVMSVTTFALWAAAPLVAARRATEASAAYRGASLALGVATALALVAGGVLHARGGDAGLGAAQRAMVGGALTWFILVAH